MHIAVLLLNRGRGSGSVARQHVRALLTHGVDVTFLHAAMEEGVADASNTDVVLSSPVLPVHEYLPGHPDQRVVATMPATLAYGYVEDYQRALEKIDRPVDLILAHHASVTAIAAHRVARHRGIPYVVFLHGTGIEPRFTAGYDDAVWHDIAGAIRGAEGLLVTTEYVRDELVLPLVDVPRDRFLVMPCGVDLDEFRPGGGAAARERYDLPPRYVVCAGALISSKGPQNVVAASKWYSDLAPTIFLGDGHLRAELEDELGDRGRFLGFVPDADKAAVINGADILTAAPEKLEHFGIVYVEGLAAGAVPVAYRGGGVDTIVTHDVGVLTERTPEHLGVAIRTLLEDPARLGATAAAARQRAVAHFDEAVLGEQLTTWLELVSQRHLMDTG